MSHLLLIRTAIFQGFQFKYVDFSAAKVDVYITYGVGGARDRFSYGLSSPLCADKFVEANLWGFCIK